MKSLKKSIKIGKSIGRKKLCGFLYSISLGHFIKQEPFFLKSDAFVTM